LEMEMTDPMNSTCLDGHGIGVSKTGLIFGQDSLYLAHPLGDIESIGWNHILQGEREHHNLCLKNTS
jgi:hypothetical protein